jgi:hypothetical protein
VFVAVTYALWWGPAIHHSGGWWIPSDIYISYFPTNALIHGHLASVYKPNSGLVTFPGILVLLAPAVALVNALHLSVGSSLAAVNAPGMWFALEPFNLLAGCAALFSVDALARRLNVPLLRRSVLMAVEIVILWNLLDNQWHPEDAVAVAMAIWGLLAAFDKRWPRCGWLLGVGMAFQPLIVLVVVAVVAVAPRRNALGLVIRAGLPGAALLAGPLLANPRATLHAIIVQPGYPGANHPTPWLHFAPHLADGAVSSGPARMVAVILASVVSWVVCRRTQRIETMAWIVALCFATRGLFEAVMVAYYIWPTLAVALVVSARRSQTRFAAACGLAAYATVSAARQWQGEWAWWSVLLLCVGMVLVLAWPGREGGPEMKHEISEGQTAGAQRI